MPELRIDPLTGQRSLTAGELSATAAAPIVPETDPFADGHEARTPPELYAVRPNGGPPNSGGWRVRVVPNLYPALEPWAQAPTPHANPELFWSGAASGAHEVIVNSPQPVVSLAELDVEQVACAVEVWRERMRVHGESACVHVIVNERREAGASLPHTHAQLYALP